MSATLALFSVVWFMLSIDSGQARRLDLRVDGAERNQESSQSEQIAVHHHRDPSFPMLWGSDLRQPWAALHHELEGRCFWKHPAWKAYLQHLQLMRSGKVRERYLTWTTGEGPGIGNNVNGILTAFYLALASGRWLKISEVSGGDPEEILQPGLVDWTVSGMPSVGNSSHRVQFYRFYKPTKAKDIMDLVRGPDRDVSIETNWVVRDTSPFMQNQTLSGVGFPEQTVLGLVRDTRELPACAFHSLFGTQQRLFEQEPLPPGPRIGIHLRFGDTVWGDMRDKRGLGETRHVTQSAVTCAQQLAAQASFASPCVIVVESDSKAAKAVAASGTGTGLCQVWTSKHDPTHTAVHGDMAENWRAWARLTAVEILLVTYSSFGRTAGKVGAPALDARRQVFFQDFMPKSADEPIACHL